MQDEEAASARPALEGYVIRRLCAAALLVLLVGTAWPEDEFEWPDRIDGHVVLNDGTPAEGAVVSAMWAGDDAAGKLKEATARADGSFQIKGLMRGRYHVRATLVRGKQRLVAETWAQASRSGSGLRLVLAPSSNPLVVHVLTPDGKAVPRFDARLLAPGGYVKLGTQSDGKLTIDSRWLGGILELWGARNEHGHGLGYAAARLGPLTTKQCKLEVRMTPGTVLEGCKLL